MSRQPNADGSLLVSAICAVGLSFSVRAYSEFLGGVLLGLGLATLAVIAYHKLKGQKN